MARATSHDDNESNEQKKTRLRRRRKSPIFYRPKTSIACVFSRCFRCTDTMSRMRQFPGRGRVGFWHPCIGINLESIIKWARMQWLNGVLASGDALRPSPRISKYKCGLGTKRGRNIANRYVWHIIVYLVLTKIIAITNGKKNDQQKTENKKLTLKLFYRVVLIW